MTKKLVRCVTLQKNKIQGSKGSSKYQIFAADGSLTIKGYIEEGLSPKRLDYQWLFDTLKTLWSLIHLIYFIAAVEEKSDIYSIYYYFKAKCCCKNV